MTNAPTARAPVTDATPSSRWKAEGQPDPHGTRYDCERAATIRGDKTDDELANALYLCDHRRSFDSIGLLTAAKDRIRWLSRALERALAHPPAAEREKTYGEGMDEAADFIFTELAEALGLPSFTPQDGSEEWKGDVRATLMHILYDAKVIDRETGKREAPGGVVVPNERLFPILGEVRAAHIPWAMIAPHGGQAERNHGGQTLEKLADRGGLDWCEALAVLNDQKFQKVENARHLVEAMVRAYRLAAAPPPPANPWDAWPEKVRVNEAMDGGIRFWAACSGCHETNEGHPTGRFNAALQCHVGLGCHECGGLGAVWQDYGTEEEFQRFCAGDEPPPPATTGSDGAMIELISRAMILADGLDPDEELKYQVRGDVLSEGPRWHAVRHRARAIREALLATPVEGQGNE